MPQKGGQHDILLENLPYNHDQINEMVELIVETVCSTKKYIRVAGVRFIAVNNNVDSAAPQDNDFTPFLNIMNEWYAKDTSNKIKAVFKSRMKDGLRCSGSIPYGYTRSPDDKQTLIVDEPAAEVVRKIFRLVCQGNSVTAMQKPETPKRLPDTKLLLLNAEKPITERKPKRRKDPHHHP